jgi:serine protease Do
MKRFLLILLCAWTLGAQAQTLRDAVAVVRPNYTAGTMKFLTDFSASLRRDGYKAAADLLAAYAKGGYGTGFLWKNEADGRYYIITNRHVVAQAENVTVELMPADAPEVKYKNCRIVAVDESAELAIIAMPDDAQFAATLGFSSVKPADGDEVYTAGFPGLGSDPSWQLGKGIVSNSAAKLKDWTIQKSARIIQHTAQVDAGSSGGPLLVKDNSAAGYSVIGINTWQARNRENANFAVAAVTMQEFLNGHFAQSGSAQSDANLQKRAQGFAKAVKDGYQQVYQYISDDYIANISVNDFYELLGSLSDSTGAEVGGCFTNGMPVDGVRIGLAEALSSRFGKRAMTFVSATALPDGTAKAVFDYEGTPINSDWTFRNVEWAMSGFAGLDMRDMARSGVATSYGYKNAVMLGVGFPANDLTAAGFSFSYEYTISTFFLFGIDMRRYGFDSPSTYWDGKNPPKEIDTVYTFKSTTAGLHAGLQFPIKVGAMYVIPNVKGYFGIGFIKHPDDSEMVGNTGYSVGLNAAYKLKRNTYLIGGLQYQSYKIRGDEYPRSRPRFLELLVGITF